jgi:NAD(P)-dependent dehydrogenase (short-subunit alcohol dehydrogenase family)
MELRGRVAIVTGGATGAGWSIVLRLVDEGVAVVVADVSDVAGDAAVAAIASRGGAGSFVRTDVRVDGDLEHMVAFASERHGGVDILVNNAGGWGPTANYPLRLSADSGARRST